MPPEYVPMGAIKTDNEGVSMSINIGVMQKLIFITIYLQGKPQQMDIRNLVIQNQQLERYVQDTIKLTCKTLYSDLSL